MARTGRYQSRLLNYLVDQTHRLNSEAGRRLRQVRLGLTWSAQILIYPLYVAFQTTRWAGRQLGRAQAVPPRQRFAAAAQDLSADAVIQVVVALGQRLAEAEAIALPAPSPSPLNQPLAEAPAPIPAGAMAVQACDTIAPPSRRPLGSVLPHQGGTREGAVPVPRSRMGLEIRALASQLSNRALVLVDGENRPVPLGAEQQWSLQQALVQAMADFHYRRRQQQLAQTNPSPLPPPSPRPNQLPGVRWFGRLMGWMQTSPLAVSANLFEEASLPLGAIAPPPFLSWDQALNQALTAQALARLDGPLSQLETDYQAKAQRSDRWRRPVVFAAKLFGFEEAVEQWLAAREQAASTTQQEPWASDLLAHGAFNQNALAQPALAQPALAQPALAPGVLAPGVLPSAALASAGRSATSGTDAPALARAEQTTGKADLAAAAAPGAMVPKISRPQALARQASGPKPSKNLTIGARLAAAARVTAAFAAGTLPPLARAPKPAALAGAAGARSQGNRAPVPPAPPSPPGDPASALAQQSQADATHEPPYLETTATFAGYEKHPLELLLDWIDRGLLWLERQGSRLWQWLRRLPQG